MNNLFSIRGNINERVSTILQIGGALFIIVAWSLVCLSGAFSPQLLPSPLDMLKALPELHFRDALVRNLFHSIYLNCVGYAEAIAICLPLGFVIGLFPAFKGMFNKQLDAIRFLPLTAVIGLFIVWFGIDDFMKIQFLTAGIVVYLLPVVVQRVQDVPEVYQQTSFTLGATKWQMFKTVFWPHVIGQLMTDIRVLVAISWSYVSIIETVGNNGGIGSLIFISSRLGRIDKVFTLLVIIAIVGIIQDKLFQWFDKMLFPYKYV